MRSFKLWWWWVYASPPSAHTYVPGSEAFFLSLDEWLLATSHDYCKLINGWVWFESHTCRGWL